MSTTDSANAAPATPRAAAAPQGEGPRATLRPAAAVPLRAQARARRRRDPERPRRGRDPRPAAAGRPGHRARAEAARRSAMLVWALVALVVVVVAHLGLPALPAAAHRHRGRLLEPPQAHRPHPAPADQRVRRPPHRRPRLARRHRHDAPLRGAHAGAGGCRRQRAHLRRRARRDGDHRPDAARARSSS